MGWASKLERDVELATELLHLKHDLKESAVNAGSPASIASGTQIELRLKAFLKQVDQVTNRLESAVRDSRRVPWDRLDLSEDVSRHGSKVQELMGRLEKYKRELSEKSEMIAGLQLLLTEKENQIASKDQSIRKLRANCHQLRAAIPQQS